MPWLITYSQAESGREPQNTNHLLTKLSPAKWLADVNVRWPHATFVLLFALQISTADAKTVGEYLTSDRRL